MTALFSNIATGIVCIVSLVFGLAFVAVHWPLTKLGNALRAVSWWIARRV